MNLWTRILNGKANRREIEADVEAFLAEKTDALIASGLSPEEARSRAQREFGNVTLTKELSGAEWSWGPFEQIANSIRYALRSLRRNPGFTLTVLLTLGLGIGVNAAIFNLLHAVVLRSLPVADAEQLRLLAVIRNHKDDEAIFSYPVLVQMQAVLGKKAGLAGFSSIAPMRAAIGKGEPEQASVQLVSGNFFSVRGEARSRAIAGAGGRRRQRNISGRHQRSVLVATIRERPRCDRANCGRE
jgi:macrolide transport system ATP-binding/permease protein